MVIGSAAARGAALGVVGELGYQAGEAEDPYAAMAELCRRPLAYRAIVLSLQSLYREELALIAAVKRRFGHVEVWLAQTDGRPAALAEAMRLGADGLLSEEGLHRFSLPEAPPPQPPAEPAALRPQPPASPPPTPEPTRPAPSMNEVLGGHEPVLTAEELRALLQDPPVHEPAAQERVVEEG